MPTTKSRARITPRTPQDQATDGQIAQLKAFAEAAIRKSGLNAKGIQQVIARGDQFKDGLIKLVRELGITNPFASEKEKPDRSFTYDPATLPTIDEQVKNQLQILVLNDVAPILVPFTGEVPKEADGLMAIPFLSDLGVFLKVDDPLGTGYGPLTEKVVELLGASRKDRWYNYRKGELTSNHVRLHAAVRTRWEALEAKTPAEEGKLRFLVLPVNTGSLFQGFSARNARADALELGRLPLGPVEVACTLIAWPERLCRYPQTFIDCSGADYPPCAGGDFSRALYFYWYGGGLRFDGDWAGTAGDGCGAAVAFLSE